MFLFFLNKVCASFTIYSDSSTGPSHVFAVLIIRLYNPNAFVRVGNFAMLEAICSLNYKSTSITNNCIMYNPVDSNRNEKVILALR